MIFENNKAYRSWNIYDDHHLKTVEAMLPINEPNLDYAQKPLICQISKSYRGNTLANKH